MCSHGLLASLCPLRGASRLARGKSESTIQPVKTVSASVCQLLYTGYDKFGPRRVVSTTREA
jgi:hypothetical protein